MMLVCRLRNKTKNHAQQVAGRLGRQSLPGGRCVFLVIPVDIFERIQAVCDADGLRSGERLILLVLLRWAGDDGRCWPSVQSIADAAGMDARTARRTLASLESKGLITKTGNTKGGRGMSVVRQVKYGKIPTSKRVTEKTGFGVRVEQKGGQICAQRVTDLRAKGDRNVRGTNQELSKELSISSSRMQNHRHTEEAPPKPGTQSNRPAKSERESMTATLYSIYREGLASLASIVPNRVPDVRIRDLIRLTITAADQWPGDADDYDPERMAHALIETTAHRPGDHPSGARAVAGVTAYIRRCIENAAPAGEYPAPSANGTASAVDCWGDTP